MKRILTLTLAVAGLMLLLAGCGKSSYISFDDVYASLTKEVDFGDNMTEMSDKALETFYFIYDAEILEDYKIYMDETGATANEIALFRLTKESDMTTVETIVKNRINDLKVSYEDYNQDEFFKVENAVVKTKGKYIMMVISSDSKTAASVIDEYLK